MTSIDRLAAAVDRIAVAVDKLAHHATAAREGYTDSYPAIPDPALRRTLAGLAESAADAIKDAREALADLEAGQ